MTGRGAREPELIGRDLEISVLADVLKRTERAGRSLVLVGEPGIGKSALLGAARAMAAQGGRQVLWSAGVEAEAGFPFAGLYQILEPVLDRLDSLADADRSALMAAFGLADGPPPELYMIASAALALLTAAAACSPVVLLVDDVQWLDPPSRDCVGYIARRLGSAPICLLATVRAGSGRRPEVLTAFAGEMAVGRLSDEAATAILRFSAAGRSGPDCRRIRDEAQGNPLALMELPASWSGGAADDEVPTLSGRLERDFGGRAAELPAPTRDLLLVAAVNDGRSSAEIFAAAAILAGHSLSAADLTPAYAAGLVLPGADEIEFRHPLVRSGILQTERLSRRQSAHAAVAAVATTPFRRAWHRAQAIVGPDDGVADELEATVEASLRRGAVLTAISSLERSAHLTSSSAVRGRRLLKAAEHAFGLGRGDLVDRLVGEAARDELGELDQARVQWLREIFNDGVPGDGVRVMDLCDTARRSAAAGDLDLALNLLLSAALRCWWADSGPVSRDYVARTVASLDAADDARAIACLAVAEPVLRAQVVTEALERRAPGLVGDVDALRLLGMAAHAIGDSPRADDYLTAAEVQLRAQQRLGVLAHALSMHVIVSLELGDWDRAAAASAEAIELADETGQPIWTAGSLVCEALALGLRGHADRALELITEVELAAYRNRLNDLLSCALLGRAIAYLTLGRNGEAFDVLSRMFEPTDPGYHQRECFGGLMFLAEAAALTGRQDEARAVMTSLEGTARRTPTPVLHLQLAYARAVLSGPGEAEAHFARARAADLHRWPWYAARLDLAYGTWLCDQDRAAQARPVLAGALTTFERIGAVHWATLARTAVQRCHGIGH